MLKDNLKKIIVGVGVLVLITAALSIYLVLKQRRLEEAREAQKMTEDISSLLSEGRFYKAKKLSYSTVLDSYDRTRKVWELIPQEIRTFSSLHADKIATWTDLTVDGELEKNTDMAHLFNLIKNFVAKKQLTQNEQDLLAFGKLKIEGSLFYFDQEKMRSWFKDKFNIDIDKHQFLYSANLNYFRLNEFDIDQKKWKVNLKNYSNDEFHPGRLSASSKESYTYTGSNAFGVTKEVLKEKITPNQFKVINQKNIENKFGEKIEIPMEVEDAKCKNFKIYYKFLPTKNDVFNSGGGAATTPTLSNPTETETLPSSAIPININELQLYCMETKKLLWTANFE